MSLLQALQTAVQDTYSNSEDSCSSSENEDISTLTAEVDKQIMEEKVQKKITHLRKLNKEKPHKKPSNDDAAHERHLLKLGTKGIVKFFNAISEHQRQQRCSSRPENTRSFAELIDSKMSVEPPVKTSRISNDILDDI
ncbi:hypothetical protein P9112_004685 [Eukaryota sp. TZLM1-RC]